MKKVGIVGAGISGLLACKYVLQEGFLPVVLEATDTLGGVWARTLETTKLQTPSFAFRFSDFPWPAGAGEYPGGEEVRDYLQSYADRFGLLRYVRVGTRVTGVELIGPPEGEVGSPDLWGGSGEAFDGGLSTPGRVWRIAARNGSGEEEVYEVDFLILCMGRYTGTPNIPSFPPDKGPEIFKGKAMHSMELYNMDRGSAAGLLKNKRVTIIGFGKTALDIAAYCANLNGLESPCTMICRSNHWHLIDSYVWGINLGLLYLNRFSELLIHKPGEGLILYILAMLLSPLRWFFSKLVESYLRCKLPLEKYGTIPNHSFFLDMASTTFAMLPNKFYDRVEEGSIMLRKTQDFCFYENRITIDDGTSLESDIVIFATGFKGDQKIRDIFTSKTLKEIVMGSSSTTVPLYRFTSDTMECIHPRIPQLAIIGYSESSMNLFTSEMRCKWLGQFLAGNFRLPSITSMEREVKEWERYMKKYLKQNFRRSSITTIHTRYCDQLCRDMGCNPRRKKGFVADWLLPYTPSDYKNLFS